MSTSTNGSSMNSNGTVSIVNDINIPLIGRFWLFLLSNIFSILCCLFLLYNFLIDQTLRHKLHNHVLIILILLCLLWEFTTVPFTMNLYLNGTVSIQNPIYCMIWKFLDSCIYTTIAKLVAWTSVERHILIFHNQWVSTKVKRLLIHYIPIMIILFYGILLQAIITPINDCNRIYSYTTIFCGYYSCVYNSVTYSLYEFLSGGVLSSFLIGFGSLTLVIRVIAQKRRFQQNFQWRKYRKMTIQLISIVSLFYVLYLPPIILSIAKRLGLPSSIGKDYNLYAQFFAYYIVFLFPFACLPSIPQLRIRLKNLFLCFYQRQFRTVNPQEFVLQTNRTRQQI